MANEAAAADPEKMKEDLEKMQKEIDASKADSDEILNEVKANAKLKGSLEKLMSHA